MSAYTAFFGVIFLRRSSEGLWLTYLYRFYQFAVFRDLFGDVLKRTRGTVLGTAYDRAYVSMDRAWRSCTVVPNPTVEFLPLFTLFLPSSVSP